MICPQCAHSNPTAAKFCSECGARLAQASAGTAPAPAALPDAAPATYTPKHLADKILTSRSALEGERKTVTVMFTDVSGFTAMSERLDPEEVHAIMDRAFEIILAEVHRHEGTVNQFLGDGVMALFGAPIAHEDHAPRALSAALAIQDGLRPLAADIARAHGLPFRMRIGVNTGSVVVGAIGRDLRMDYTAVGDTTNLAARLLGIAQPGQIVAATRTRSLADHLFVFEDLGDFQLKGKSEPVRGFAVTGRAWGRSRLEGTTGRVLTPLVGRATQLAALEETWRRALAGEGRSVLVSGDAGAGKSRLLFEFLRKTDRRELLALETTCASYGSSIPYRPVVELLRLLVDTPETITAAALRQHITDRLAALGRFDEEQVALLAHLVDASTTLEPVSRLSGAELRERTFEALCRLFLAASATAPLLLVIENVHWMDQSSAEFVRQLAARLPGHRVLLLLSARLELPSTLQPPEALSITVGRLGVDDVADIARATVGAGRVSPALLDLLVDKGEGNPLYVEELILQLRDTGHLVIEDDEARLASDDVHVPARINDIIAARVDRLAAPLKLTLQGAAVVGRRFGIGLVSRVLDVPAPDVEQHLRQLHALDFVFPSAVDPEPMYSFKHALTQDVVYLGLLERTRRRYHAAAGRGLEELYAMRLDDVVELLAYQFGASPDDDRAVDYAVLAAVKAQRRWANTEALGYFDRAVKRLVTMPDTPDNRRRRIDVVLKQAEIKFALGRHAEHIEALEALQSLVESSADPPTRAAWHYWTGFFHSLTGARPEIPIGHCHRASEIAEAAGLEEIRASANCCLAHVYAYAGRLHEALEAGERALPVFEASGNVWWACRTLWGLSLTTIPLGLWDRSLEYCRRALAYGEDVNDRRLKVVGWWRTGWTHIQRGELERGLQCCEQAIALGPSPLDATMAKAVQGYGLVKLGKIDAGIAALTEAVEWLDRARLVFTRTWYALWLADARLIIGDRRAAQALAQPLLATTRAAGYRYFEGMAERILGTALVDVDATAAGAHLESARHVLQEVGADNEVGKLLVAQSALRQAAGDVAGARDALRCALDIFERLGTLDEPPRVRSLLAALG